MAKVGRKTRFYFTAQSGMLSTLFQVFLMENFNIRADFYRPRKTKITSRDFLFHHGTQPFQRPTGTSPRLVVFQSDWNEADRLLWEKAGANYFLNLSDPLEKIHQAISSLLKS